MICLDCENPASAVESLAQIYDTTQDCLFDFFRSFDIDEHYELNIPELSGAQEIRRILEERFGPVQRFITRTYWYHLSRTVKGASFEEGVLPLNAALPRIWQMLFRMFEGSHHADRLRSMAEQGVENFQYNYKTPDPLHWGPYGMLVKDIGFCAAAVTNHDYLKIPEIIEDICCGYESRFGERIQPTVEKSLVPTIVKFWAEDAECMHGLTPAIYYAYLSCRGLELSSSANTCFDGRGKVVPKDRIVYVEQ